jgi:hypothetical protein
MTKIPVVRPDKGEGFLMQDALGVEFADEVGSIATLAFRKQADEAVTGWWATQTRAAVGDKDVGGSDQIASKLENLSRPPFDARHAVEAINADGPADKEPGLSVD